MKKILIPCLALSAIMYSCTKEETDNNLTPAPAAPVENTTGSDSADYFISANINGAPWENRGVGASVSRRHVGTDTDTLHTYWGQSNVAGTYTRVYAYLMNFEDTGSYNFTQASLELRPITSDPIYNDSHIYTSSSTLDAMNTEIHITKDNDTIVEGTFRGRVYRTDMQDSIMITDGKFKLKWQ